MKIYTITIEVDGLIDDQEIYDETQDYGFVYNMNDPFSSLLAVQNWCLINLRYNETAVVWENDQPICYIGINNNELIIKPIPDNE
jgi:lipoate-protein ligase A